jgi:LPS sulfotransferase NodH
VHAALSAVGSSDYVPFIVLTRSRCGSNLLLSYLNSHPHVFVEAEIFWRMNGRDPIARLRRTFGKQPRRVRARGFKIFYYHPLDHAREGLWNELEAMEALRIIHLRRENVLRTLVSRKVAQFDRVWLAEADVPSAPKPRVTFTVPELEAGFSQTRDWEESAARRFCNHATIRVTYENLVANPAETMESTLQFLGLGSFRLHTTLRRQNPERLSELIENYQDLRDAFENTPWRRYFVE